MVLPAPGDKPTATAPQPGTIDADLFEAERLLSLGDAAGAEKQFSMLSLRAGMTPEQQVRSLRGFALSSEANKHPFVALGALESWRSAAPGADADPEWLAIWERCLNALPPAEGRKRAVELANDAARTWEARQYAASWLAAAFAENKQPESGIRILGLLAKQLPDREGLAHFEETLYERLAKVSTTGVQQLAGTLTPANEEEFPYRIIALEQARRMLGVNARALPAIEMLERLTRAKPFASQKLLPMVLTQAVPLEPKRDGSGGRELALLLPMSGPYAEIAWKIVLGVNAAQWEASAGGQPVAVHVINTESPDWLTRLASLPASCRVVGGPLRTAVYTQAKQAGALAGRVLFSFTQRLDGGDEGMVAWRFFGSPEDQVAALLAFAGEQGATTYGILHPNDSYGTRMAEIFSSAARSRGFSVQKVSAYPLGEHEEWTKTVRGYLSAVMKEKDPIPNATFEATFLPDNWLNSEMLVPNLFFYNEEKQILLATNLWEQDLTGKSKIDARNFGLAVFPSAWDPTHSAPAAVNLNLLLADAGLPEPGYWTALGYDFVRFALHLDLPGGVDAATVNDRLARLSGFSWSAAPIRWNAQGLAVQEFKLFTPTDTGYEPVDPDAFKKRLERARTRQAQRIQMIRKK